MRPRVTRDPNRCTGKLPQDNRWGRQYQGRSSTEGNAGTRFLKRGEIDWYIQKEEALKMGRITKERHDDGKARELHSPKSGSVGLTYKNHKTHIEKKSWKWCIIGRTIKTVTATTTNCAGPHSVLSHSLPLWTSLAKFTPPRPSYITQTHRTFLVALLRKWSGLLPVLQSLHSWAPRERGKEWVFPKTHLESTLLP